MPALQNLFTLSYSKLMNLENLHIQIETLQWFIPFDRVFSIVKTTELNIILVKKKY